MQYRANTRWISNVSPAITGMNGSFITNSIRFSVHTLAPSIRGSSGLMSENTMTLTIATMTRNVVPQRGCSVVLERAFATVSSCSAS